MWKKCKNDLAKVWLGNRIQQKRVSAKQATRKWVGKCAAALVYSYALRAAGQRGFGAGSGCGLLLQRALAVGPRGAGGACGFPGGPGAASRCCAHLERGARAQRRRWALGGWELGGSEHTAAMCDGRGAEAPCPLNSETPLRAGVGAGRAVPEETPSESLPRAAPLPAAGLSGAWHHPPVRLPVASQKPPLRPSGCLTQLCPGEPGETLFPGLLMADGGRNLLDPAAPWGEAWWV